VLMWSASAEALQHASGLPRKRILHPGANAS